MGCHGCVFKMIKIQIGAWKLSALLFICLPSADNYFSLYYIYNSSLSLFHVCLELWPTKAAMWGWPTSKPGAGVFVKNVGIRYQHEVIVSETNGTVNGAIFKQRLLKRQHFNVRQRLVCLHVAINAVVPMPKSGAIKRREWHLPPPFQKIRVFNILFNVFKGQHKSVLWLCGWGVWHV